MSDPNLGAWRAQVSLNDDVERRLAALEAGLSRREPMAGGDYGRGDGHLRGLMGAHDAGHTMTVPPAPASRVFPRDLPPDTRGDSATGYARQEHCRVTLRKKATTITVTGSEGVIRSLELDGWLPA